MQTFKRWITILWPIGILGIFELILAAKNYVPGTYLMGWDNIMPEFNFSHALTTNIFGAWLEYRGTGLPDGMGHAANLIHTLVIWLFSLTLPHHMLRYAFHFLVHFLGMAGMYVFLNSMTKKPLPSLFGGLFYGVNLIAIQLFYTPLEAFSVHFASLPWLAYSLTRYLEKPYRNTLLLFTFVSFLATPQYFVPTFILPTALLLIAISLPFLRNGKAILIAAGVFAAVNLFWALPYVVSLPTNGPIIEQAKINQMSSEEVYERNRAFGDVKNVITFKGMLLDYEDVDADGIPRYVMQPWRVHLATPMVRLITVLFAGVLLMSIVQACFIAVKKRDMRRASIVLLWCIAFLLLANNTPLIMDVGRLLREHVPFFSEAYRFPFTKFGLLFAAASSILMTLSLASVSKASLSAVITLTVLIASIVTAQPAFNGAFFYTALRVRLPDDYPKLFSFMEQLDHTGRTAYLPAPSYWSWKQYTFGYIGSGFLWFGFPQPLMDRAFDPWSKTNETYYWEFSRALYSKDAEALRSVLAKYQIRYLILDGHIRAQGHDRALFTEDTQELFAKLPNIRLLATIGSILVYENGEIPSSPVHITGTLPRIGAITGWTDEDRWYQSLGTYAVTNHGTDTPSSALFTKRSTKERYFTIDESESTITIQSDKLQDSTSSAAIDKSTAVASTRNNQLLNEQAVKPCGVLKQGLVSAEQYDDALRIQSRGQNACISFSLPELPHHGAYLVAIESRHVVGRPLMVSLINMTARHVETETHLTPRKNNDWQTDYFVLPPLAADGLGYGVYITSAAIGAGETVNDIRHVTVYPLDYDGLTAITPPSVNNQSKERVLRSVTHPNPSLYRIQLSGDGAATVLLDQAYNEYWRAYDITGVSVLGGIVPWLFGTEIPAHLTVNNWQNGWEVGSETRDIAVIFLPQLLGYLGYGVLVSIFLGVLFLKK